MKQLNLFVIVLIILSGIMGECCYANNPVQSYSSTQYPQYPIGGYGGRFGGLLYGLAMQAPAHKSEVSKEIKEIDGAYYHIHTVVENDTYQTLANAYHTTKKTIKKLNPNVSIIKGASLMIPVSDKEMAEIIKREENNRRRQEDEFQREIAYAQAVQKQGGRYISTSNYIQSDIQRSSQNSTSHTNTENVVTLVVTGEGKTKDEATKLALRSAIEQAFGVFVSANTQILNDEIVKDEIATISSGNIQKYTELGCITNNNGMQVVTLSATVAIGNLVNYVKSKGLSVELSGAQFAMSVKIKELNKQNELIAIENLYDQVDLFALNNQLFDYKLKVSEPKLTDIANNQYTVNIIVEAYPNDNMYILKDLFINTINAIALPDEEIKEYLRIGLPFYEHYAYPRLTGKIKSAGGDYYNAYKDTLLYLRNKVLYGKSLISKTEPSIYKSLFKFRILANNFPIIRFGYVKEEEDHSLFNDSISFSAIHNGEKHDYSVHCSSPLFRGAVYEITEFEPSAVVSIKISLRMSLDDISKLSSFGLELTPTINELIFE